MICMTFITSCISRRCNSPVLLSPLLCLWDLHCAPLQRYRAPLWTIILLCAPMTCIVNHGAQEGLQPCLRYITHNKKAGKMSLFHWSLILGHERINLHRENEILPRNKKVENLEKKTLEKVGLKLMTPRLQET